MYCRTCGADIPEGARYCNRCGTHTAPEERTPSESQTPTTEGRKDHIFDRVPLLWGVLGIGICLLLSIFLVGGEEWDEEMGSAILNSTDYRDPVTRDYALSLIRPGSGGDYNIAQTCDIWEHVYERWNYVEDPRTTEYFSPASRTIEIGLKGDCDDFAILVAALTEAVGGRARIIAAYNALDEGHAFTEVYVGDDYEDVREAAYYICERFDCETVWYQESENFLGTKEYWINLDWWNDHPGGDFFPYEDAFAISVDGEWESLTYDNSQVRSIRLWTRS